MLENTGEAVQVGGGGLNMKFGQSSKLVLVLPSEVGVQSIKWAVLDGVEPVKTWPCLWMVRRQVATETEPAEGGKAQSMLAMEDCRKLVDVQVTADGFKVSTLSVTV